jgi:hypothetical protein
LLKALGVINKDSAWPLDQYLGRESLKIPNDKELQHITHLYYEMVREQRETHWCRISPSGKNTQMRRWLL